MLCFPATQDASDAGLRQRRVSGKIIDYVINYFIFVRIRHVLFAPDVSSNDVSLDEAFELLRAWNSVLKLKSKGKGKMG